MISNLLPLSPLENWPLCDFHKVNSQKKVHEVQFLKILEFEKFSCGAHVDFQLQIFADKLVTVSRTGKLMEVRVCPPGYSIWSLLPLGKC